MIEIFKEFSFEAAHRLPNVPNQHKCARLHGHSFRVTIHVSGDLDPHLGWVCDFTDISQAFAPILQQLDHNYLNDIEGLSNPTSEHIATWIWRHLSPSLPSLCAITIRETCTSGCTYRGPTVMASSKRPKSGSRKLIRETASKPLRQGTSE